MVFFYDVEARVSGLKPLLLFTKYHRLKIT